MVEERAGCVVLHFPRGAPARFPVDAAGREVRIPAATGWTLAERSGRRDALALYRRGARHSLWLFWNDDASFARWYVNFERPLLRTRLGFDVQDEKLDLVVDASGAVRWKDEDELEEAAARGLLDAGA